MKNKIPTITNSLCYLPAELQPEVAAFLEEHRECRALTLLEMAVQSHLAKETNVIRDETLAECRKVYLDKIYVFEVLIAEWRKETAEESAQWGPRREQLLDRIELLFIDHSIRFRKRQRQSLITLSTLLFFALSMVIAFAAKSTEHNLKKARPAMQSAE